MTEKEKMLAHQMYDANYNKELHDERIAAKELCWEYNPVSYTHLTLPTKLEV